MTVINLRFSKQTNKQAREKTVLGKIIVWMVSSAVEYLCLMSDPGLYAQHGIGERLACKVMNKSLERQSIL